MTFNDIEKAFEIDCTKNLIGEDDLKEIEKSMNAIIGKELQEYILKYGYLGCGFVELYGIYSNMMQESDMVKQSNYLHKYYKKTDGFIALENIGEADYVIIDSKDEVYEYNSVQDEITILGKDLIEYIYERFKKL